MMYKMDHNGCAIALKLGFDDVRWYVHRISWDIVFFAYPNIYSVPSGNQRRRKSQTRHRNEENMELNGIGPIDVGETPNMKMNMFK